MRTNMPGFTAATCGSSSRYCATAGGTFTGGSALPQLKLPTKIFLDPCALAYDICSSDAAQYQWDAHGECAWYTANCLPSPPPSGGGGGDPGGFGGGGGHGPKHQ